MQTQDEQKRICCCSQLQNDSRLYTDVKHFIPINRSIPLILDFVGRIESISYELSDETKKVISDAEYALVNDPLFCFIFFFGRIREL